MKHPGRNLSADRDLCLCGSGKLILECHLGREKTAPKPPKTGYSHPSCYARELGDCSTKISSEHYFSASILRQIGKNGISSNIHDKPLSVNSFVGNMLCDRHNSHLGKLDAVAGDFFRFLFSPWPSSGVEVHLTRGLDLERWMLKVVVGIVSIGLAGPGGQKVPGWKPPEAWLNILFGPDDFRPPLGINLVAGSWSADQNAVLINAAFTPSGDPGIIVVALAGIVLALSLYPLPEGGKLPENTYFRPELLQVTNGKAIREVHFGCPEGQAVFIEVRPT